MKSFAAKVLEIAVNGTIVLFITSVLSAFVVQIGDIDMKKESSWPRLYTYEDRGYWVTRDQTNPESWVILDVQQK